MKLTIALACVLLGGGCAPSSSGTPTQEGSGGAGTGGATAAGTGGAVSAGTGGAASGGAPSNTASGGAGVGSGGATIGTGGASENGSGGTLGTGGGGGGRMGSGGQGGAPVSSACSNGAVFCDDFEGQTVMAAPGGQWTSRMSGTATVVVDTEHAHSGTKSVHFHGPSGTTNLRAYILTQKAAPFPIVSDVLYVRFMLYIGRYIILSSSTAHNRMVWLGARGVLEAGGGAGLGYIFSTYNGIAIERLETNQGFQRDTTQHLEDASRAGKWQCFEFSIDNKGGVPSGEKSDSTAVPHIWQDGVALKLTPGGSVDTWRAIPFEALQISLWGPQSDSQATDYWIDDVAVSTQRINCPTP